jgi:UDP-N-acetylglucosamine 1-carboxyvinyltransferase
MYKYVVEGSHPLKGRIKASGNKNAALPCLAATLLTDEPVILKNIPEIEDVNTMIEILKILGSEVKRLGKNHFKIITRDIRYLLPALCWPVMVKWYFPRQVVM